MEHHFLVEVEDWCGRGNRECADKGPTVERWPAELL